VGGNVPADFKEYIYPKDSSGDATTRISLSKAMLLPKRLPDAGVWML